MSFHFVTASDVLMPRGNGAFGSAGQHGQTQSLPWPSVFAGALRSALLAADTGALRAFPRRPLGTLGDVLGTPADPGSFRLRWLSFAQRDAQGRIEPVIPLPADRVVFDTSNGKRAQVERALRPTPWPAGLQGSGTLPMVAMLRGAPAGKAAIGQIAGCAALLDYLADEAPVNRPPMPPMLRSELRLGIELDSDTRTAADGALYTTEALRFARRGEPLHDEQLATFDAGYLVGIDGAADLLPVEGVLRLGGDGRAALHQADLGVLAFQPPVPPLAQVERDRRFRIVLLTPALWPSGSLPPRLHARGGEQWLQLDGFSARLACAAVSRAEVVSGWDMDKRRPKDAQRAVPAGSVFWFDQADGNVGKLAAWVESGLWPDTVDTMRRAEGFNNALLGAWSPAPP